MHFGLFSRTNVLERKHIPTINFEQLIRGSEFLFELKSEYVEGAVVHFCRRLYYVTRDGLYFEKIVSGIIDNASLTGSQHVAYRYIADDEYDAIETV